MRLLAVFTVFLLVACAPRKTTEFDGVLSAHVKEYELDDETLTNARYYYMRGQLALASDDLPKAEQYLTQAAKLEPSSAPSLRNSLAFMYVRNAKYDEALAAVDHGLKLEPKNVELLRTKAAVYAASKRYDEAIQALLEIKDPPASKLEEYYNFLSTLYLQKGDINGAQRTLTELANKRPDSLVTHVQLGRVYEASGNPARAELEYSKALEINSENRALVVDLARTLTSQKKYGEAERVLDRAIVKDPSESNLRSAKVQLYLLQQKHTAAIAELRQLAKIEPDPAQTNTRIAIILLEQKRYKEAAAILESLLAEKPDQLGLNYYLASALVNLKKLEEAKQALSQIKPGLQLFVESRVMAASIAQQQKDYPGALEFLNEGLKSRPDSAQLLSFKAQMLRELGQKDEALAIQQQVIKLEPNEDKHKFLYAVYLDELGRKPEAVVVLRGLIQMNPKNSAALNYLGYTMVETDGSNLQEAELFIKQAIAIEPNNGYYIDSLGWLYFKQQRFKDAERELARAVKFVPDDAVILEHYVRSLIEVGNRKAAKSYLAKAKKHAPHSDDKEVGQRLEELAHSLNIK
jgi:predicted Zn-dependent protease